MLKFIQPKFKDVFSNKYWEIFHSLRTQYIKEIDASKLIGKRGLADGEKCWVELKDNW